VDRNILEGRAKTSPSKCGEERVNLSAALRARQLAGNALRNLVSRPRTCASTAARYTEFLYAFFGAIKIAPSPFPVNTQPNLAITSTSSMISLARVAIVSESLLPQLQAIPRQDLRHLREIVVVGAPDHAPSTLVFKI